MSITALFQAMNLGTLDVADTTAAATTIPIPFGAVANGASALLLRNRTGQEVNVAINGALTPSHTIPTGGVQLIASAGLAVDTPITSLNVVTTATQAGIGYIDYFVFGDDS